ncbi:hypothetical protein [Halorubrum vacuolatum]|uniref:Uncharacterized protein n=1 Tax=Halorubrum vacuolatum TaxID=63740 RepID=A0A238VAI9_HALVU|nr:hypothetical protein [Halorubrum vacuolatum]SNR31134.1 hypothetical protein SAMN06264855_102145 [Halorubrum vacuolatum]
MSGSSGGESAGPGLGSVIAAMVFTFVTVSLLGIYLGDINSTQAVLIGGAGAVVSAIVAVKTGKRAAG